MSELRVPFRIADCLDLLRNRNIRQLGFAYLHPQALTRYQAHHVRNWRLFQHLCGESADVGRMVPITTMRANLGAFNASARANAIDERRMLENPVFWETMQDRGCNIHYIPNDQQTLLDLVADWFGYQTWINIQQQEPYKLGDQCEEIMNDQRKYSYELKNHYEEMMNDQRKDSYELKNHYKEMMNDLRKDYEHKLQDRKQDLKKRKQTSKVVYTRCWERPLSLKEIRNQQRKDRLRC